MSRTDAQNGVDIIFKVYVNQHDSVHKLLHAHDFVCVFSSIINDFTKYYGGLEAFSLETYTEGFYLRPPRPY